MKNRTKMRLLPLAAAAIATLFAFGAPATHLSAYTTIGAKWSSSSVRYYVNPSNKYVTDAAALAAVQYAASMWTGISNVQLVYGGTTSGSTLANNGKNEVFFRDDAPGPIAETYYWYDGSGRLLDADIVFHEGFKFYAGNTGCASDGFYIENTGTHEFGHSLGLGHSTVDVATMWPYSGACEVFRETPDTDDISGLKSLYGGSTNTTQPPNSPTGLSAGATAADPTGSIALSWSDNATNESGYNVERSADGATFTLIAQLSSNATTFVDSGLPSGTSFWYRVDAFNGAGASAYSNVASSQTTTPAPAPAPVPPTAAPPTTPATPSPSDGAGNQATTVTLAWSASNAASFDVYVNGALQASNIPATSLRLTVSPGTRYSWQVVAKNSVGSTTGPNWSFTTKRGGKK